MIHSQHKTNEKTKNRLKYQSTYYKSHILRENETQRQTNPPLIIIKQMKNIEY